MDVILKRLDELERLIKSLFICQKDTLTFQEGCVYCDLSDSYMYKLTHFNKIPFYKPNGKKVYFKKAELDGWILSNRIASREEANVYLNKKRRNER